MAKLNPADLDLLVPTKPPAPTLWTSWATVTSASPLRVRLDGETVPLSATPVDLVGGLAVGNRVRVAVDKGQPYIVGRLGGRDLSGYATTARTNRGCVVSCAANTYQVATFPLITWSLTPTLAWGEQGWWHTLTDQNAVAIDVAGHYSVSAVVVFARTGDQSRFCISPQVIRVDSTGWVRVQVIGLGQPNNRMIAGLIGSGAAGLPLNVEHTASSSVTTNTVSATLTIEKLT